MATLEAMKAAARERYGRDEAFEIGLVESLFGRSFTSSGESFVSRRLQCREANGFCQLPIPPPRGFVRPPTSANWDYRGDVDAVLAVLGRKRPAVFRG